MAPQPMPPPPEPNPAEDGRARERARGARLVAVFLVGCAMLVAPLPRIASQAASVLGLPLAFVYLFVGWGLVIALVGLAIGLGGRTGRSGRSED